MILNKETRQLGFGRPAQRPNDRLKSEFPINLARGCVLRRVPTDRCMTLSGVHPMFASQRAPFLAFFAEGVGQPYTGAAPVRASGLLNT